MKLRVFYDVKGKGKMFRDAWFNDEVPLHRTPSSRLVLRCEKESVPLLPLLKEKDATVVGIVDITEPMFPVVLFEKKRRSR